MIHLPSYTLHFVQNFLVENSTSQPVCTVHNICTKSCQSKVTTKTASVLYSIQTVYGVHVNRTAICESLFASYDFIDERRKFRAVYMTPRPSLQQYCRNTGVSDFLMPWQHNKYTHLSDVRPPPLPSPALPLSENCGSAHCCRCLTGCMVTAGTWIPSHWGRGFQSHSRHECLSAFILCLCCSVCR
jgi:hypothetical protein